MDNIEFLVWVLSNTNKKKSSNIVGDNDLFTLATLLTYKLKENLHYFIKIYLKKHIKALNNGRDRLF